MNLAAPDLVNLHGQDTGRECLSTTRIGSLLACNQKYYWRYEKGLEPAVKSVALDMGSAFALALERGDPDAGYGEILRIREDAREVFDNDPWVVVPSEEDSEIQATIVRAAAGAYLDHYGPTERREVTMRSRLRNPETGAWSQTFDVQARIDGLNGDTLIEDKFTSRVDAKTDLRLRLDRQVTLGCYLLWRTTGETVREVSYRMTKKPSIKRTQRESHAEYLHRVERDYRERPDFYLHEFPVTRTEDDFLRLEAELWAWAEQIRQARARGVYPRNTAACMDFAGCEFLDACCASPGWETQFVKREQGVA